MDIAKEIEKFVEELRASGKEYKIVTTDGYEFGVSAESVLLTIANSLRRGDQDWEWLEGYSLIGKEFDIEGFNDEMTDRFKELVSLVIKLTSQDNANAQ